MKWLLFRFLSSSALYRVSVTHSVCDLLLALALTLKYKEAWYYVLFKAGFPPEKI
jgi:hypothetical protein